MPDRTALTDPAFPARAVGALTVAYSVAVLIAPKVLAKPCGLTGPLGGVSAPVALLVRAVAARDVVLGTRMLLAPAGPQLQAASLARAAADASDAVLFGIALDGAARKAKVVGFAAGWAALSTWAGLRGGR